MTVDSTTDQSRASTPGRSKFVVGLVGGMGAGKSQIAAAFARRGAAVIDADAYGHEALRQPAIRDQIAARWGEGVLDAARQVDRRKLGARVFADPAERQALEALVFPWIERRIGEDIDRARADPAVPLVVLDAAIMLETGWGDRCDRIVYVDAPRPLRLARLRERRGWTEADLAAREAAQMPLADKAKRAAATIDNAGSLDDLQAHVDRLMLEWGTAGK